MRCLKHPDGTLYVWTEALSKKPGMTETEIPDAQVAGRAAKAEQEARARKSKPEVAPEVVADAMPKVTPEMLDGMDGKALAEFAKKHLGMNLSEKSPPELLRGKVWAAVKSKNGAEPKKE